MSLSSPVAIFATDDGVVSASSSPDRPVRRRSFTPSQKLKAEKDQLVVVRECGPCESLHVLDQE